MRYHSGPKEAYRVKLHVEPAAEREPSELRRTGRWPWILVASGVLLSSAMVVFYALPFARSLGRSGGELAGGELWLALGVGGVLVVNGLLVWWQTSRRPQKESAP